MGDSWAGAAVGKLATIFLALLAPGVQVHSATFLPAASPPPKPAEAPAAAAPAAASGSSTSSSRGSGGGAAAASAASAAAAAAAAPACWPQWGAGVQRTALFVADPGSEADPGDASAFLANLQGALRLPAGASGCPNVTLGRILGQDVAVVATGAGSNAASMCVFEVLLRCGPVVRDAAFSGVSNWSPQLGGIVNNGSCEAGGANGNGLVTRIGDVCISPFASSWSCRVTSWSDTAASYPNQCAFPKQQPPPPYDPFGTCAFFAGAAAASVPLAQEAAAAASKGLESAPPGLKMERPGIVRANELQYWAMMSAGTGLEYALDPDVKPRVWGLRECTEVSSELVWSGAPWDMVARKAAADTITAAGLEDRIYTQLDAIAVSATEGVGVAAAFDRYASIEGGRQVPYVIVRGMAGPTVQPLRWANATVGAGGGRDGAWLDGPWIPPDLTTGPGYALRSASAAVLFTLQQRCLQAGGKQASCAFSL